VLAIRDRFSGDARQILSWNMMASGPVSTPRGPFTPEARRYSAYGTRKDLPSAGPTISLAPGPNRFGFIGQWLIDWDVYVSSEAPAEALIGDWGHDWHPSTEQAQFAKANGRTFEEAQHILRMRSAGPWQFLILPRRKGEDRGVEVREVGSDTVIVAGEERTVLRADSYSYTGPGKTVLAAFGIGPVASGDLAIEGGPAEVVLTGDRLTVSMHGPPGVRHFKFKDTQWEVDYPGGAPVTVER
jgi:hypothetical protein